MKNKCSNWKKGIFDSEIEILATKDMVNNYDEILHRVITYYKGSNNVCLLSEKSKYAL